jgi:hypothetical protein
MTRLVSMCVAFELDPASELRGRLGSRIDLSSRPSAMSVAAVLPPVLRISTQFKVIDLPDLEDQETEVGKGLLPAGCQRGERRQRLPRPAGVGPGVSDPRLVGHLAPDCKSGLLKLEVGMFLPHQARGSAQAELLPGLVEVPAELGPGRLFEFRRLQAPGVGREGQTVGIVEEPAKDECAYRGTPVLSYRGELDETRLRNSPVPVEGQVK